MPKKVIVYTAGWCIWCHRLAEFLKKHKVAYEARDVEEGKNGEEAMKKSGQAGIPVIDVDGQILVGYNEPKLRELLKLK